MNRIDQKLAKFYNDYNVFNKRKNFQIRNKSFEPSAEKPVSQSSKEVPYLDVRADVLSQTRKKEFLGNPSSNLFSLTFADCTFSPDVKVKHSRNLINPKSLTFQN
mmetsp:Transcript_12361/g.14136  ORF Transcript_12361/g.14136 Transcript_12361/m.14136 type:complete len:105 (-) Transcript_12361:80-394(-)